jgi:hypothetical protein
MREGARGGAIAAAAITGALVGFGVRDGMIARPFNAMAALLLGNRARGIWAFDARVSSVGFLVLVICCAAAGVALRLVIAAFAPRSRAAAPHRVALAVGLIASVIALAIIVARAPDFVGPAPVGALSVMQGIIVAFVAAIAFAAGMGLAR